MCVGLNPVLLKEPKYIESVRIYNYSVMIRDSVNLDLNLYLTYCSYPSGTTQGEMPFNGKCISIRFSFIMNAAPRLVHRSNGILQ